MPLVKSFHSSSYQLSHSQNKRVRSDNLRDSFLLEDNVIVILVNIYLPAFEIISKYTVSQNL